MIWKIVFILFYFQRILCLNEVRWCTISNQENKKCNDMKNAFGQAKITPTLSCVTGNSEIDCARMIMNNEADAVTLKGEFIYEAGTKYYLKPVAGEVYDQGMGTSYYAVAVVRKNSTYNINNLKGAKSCHTGFQKNAGWNVPIGYLIDTGRIAAVACDIQKAVNSFFSKSCVPGAIQKDLCQLCIGDTNGNNVCQLNGSLERYSGYSGAFRCLVEGQGDVAFIKHSTVAENSDGRNTDPWAQAVISSDYELLCRDGSRAEVSEWRQCNLAKVPAHAVMTQINTDGALIYKMLHDGQQRYNSHSSGFKMFDSSAYNSNNLLFSDMTTELRAIADQTYQTWLGDEYLQAMKGIDCKPDQLPKSLRWCTLSTQEIWKCADMASAFKNKSLDPSLQCVSADSPEACMKMIQQKEVDAVTLNGGDIYKAGKTYGLVPAAGEGYPDTIMSSSYYAVALVHRNPLNAFTIHDLKGKKSCHTGYERTAGWNVPIGTLIKQGFIKPDGCNTAKAVATFFSESCVPGANQKYLPPELCNLCKGDDRGQNKCEKDSRERYFGYSGAFRCLAEKTGDVAFVKHSTVFELTDGKSTEPWAQTLKSSDFQLLCPNGARAEVSQYTDCNWAQVPAHAVMVHPDTNIYIVYGLLANAQEYYGTDSSSQFKMFDSSVYNANDLIFKDSTDKIVPVQEKKTYSQWLGSGYIESWESMQCSSSAAQKQGTISFLLISMLLFMTFSV
ncbi:melanotransferrin isoform X1 [Xenopus laevis]|uniref:Melanotransferrin n=1 Tax=Xenopus laevis TaxID=8355 RepID=A0A8J0VH64_XENLA|nr:melanotransferrin isoform X1 [Xenopus laevis]